MNFNRQSVAECVIPPVPVADPRCENAEFALAHPGSCGAALIIKPSVLILCVGDSIRFRVYEYKGGVETEITTGITYESTDPAVFTIGVNSGSGTCFAAGLIQVIATHTDGRTVSAHVEVNLADACCDEVTVATAIVVDKSRSMSLNFGGSYPSRLHYANAVATAYGGTISEVDDAPKDSVKVWSFEGTVNELTGFSQTIATITDAIAGITQTQNKTDLLEVFTTVADDLLDETADRRILLLISDGEHTEDTNIQAILDAASLFKDAGGLVVVIGIRASGAGFDLLERVATGGYFINAASSTAASTLTSLNFVKKLLCAGECIPVGDEYKNEPTTNYSSFLHWEVLSGMVNLLGPGLLDLEPDNGLYVELASGEAKATIRTIDSYTVTAGLNYRLSFEAAGNQRLAITGQGIKAYVRAVGANDSDPNIFETTIFPDWDSEFQTYAFSFSPIATASVKIYFEQLGTDSDPSAGTLLDDVKFEESSTLSKLLEDGFDSENLTYIQPACGPSSPLEAISDAESVAVTWIGDFSDSLIDAYKYTYGITYVTNEGETGVTTLVFAREEVSHERTSRRVDIPQPDSGRVTSIRIWRSLGEQIGADPDSYDLFLFAEVPVGQTILIDDESHAQFAARYDNSFQAPTANSTGVGFGGLGYGVADCCYYSYMGEPGVDALTAISNASAPTVASLTYSGGHMDPTNPRGPSYVYTYLTDEGETAITLGVSEGSDSFSPGENAMRVSFTVPANPRIVGVRIYRYRWTTSPTDIFKLLVELAPSETSYVDTESYESWESRSGSLAAAPTSNTTAVVGQPGGLVSTFTNNCPVCDDAPPGLQSPDSNPLPDIESGFTPPVSYTSTKTFCASCDPGFANLKTTGETYSLVSNTRTTVSGSDDVIPTMTGPTSPSGQVIASHSAVVDNQPFKAFDGDADTYWIPEPSVIEAWIGYKFDTAKIINRYTIQAIALAVGAPTVWTFEGSNDGSVWTVLDSRSIESPVHWSASESKSFTFSNTTSFTRYRLNITETNGTSTQNLNIAEITMGADDVDVINTTVQLATAVAPGYYKVGGISGFFPKAWHFDGSNDGSTWAVLDTKYNQASYNGQSKSNLVTGNTTAYLYFRLVITEFTGTLSLAQPPLSGSNFVFAATPASVCKSATETSYKSRADADKLATDSAEALARAEISCVPVYTATGNAQAVCPFNQYGLPVNKSATVISLVSQADAQEQADAAALYAAEAERDCTLSNNDQQITINDRAGASGPVAATPYPSVQYVAGKAGVITGVTVAITGLTHDSPDDIHILLVHPDGVTCVELMANCGGANAISAVNLTFSQAAGSFLPDSTQISSGTFKPSQFGSTGAAFYPAPAPQTAPSTSLAAFNGLSPNGSFSLFVCDDTALYGGTISGWEVTVTSA